MKIVILIIAFIFLGCKNVRSEKEDDIVVVKPPQIRNKNFEGKKVWQARNAGTDCRIQSPDLSVNEIYIGKGESLDKIKSKSTQDENGEYSFYSIANAETLTLKQYSIDKISSIHVEVSDKASYRYLTLPAKTFKTQNGIKLGISSAELKRILGDCFVAIDSSENYFRLYYRTEDKNPKNKFLKVNSAEGYYASYEFCNDKLTEFEFGFEYK